MTAPALPTEIEGLLRDLAPRVLGSLVRRFGDFAAAEDAVQEALLAAALQWPKNGVPDNPRGWLIRVASRRGIDNLRREISRRRRETLAFLHVPENAEIVAPPDHEETVEREEDALVLLFLCCHDALSDASAIALTLRAVGGLTTAEIAGAFLVPEATMAQRISRAKQTIKASGVPFALPTEEEKDRRVRAVLHVLYLIFNEGYTTTAGTSLHRADLSGEAIRLSRLVHQLLPEDAEAAGLLALMLLTDARRPARAGPNGELIPLREQDRSRWDRRAIEEGVALISATLPRRAVGEYQLQAAIAALHDEAARAEDTDWPQILALYGLLKRMTDNPMVALNHAVAAAMVSGPAAGLALLDELAAGGRLAGHHRLDAVRAHLLEESGEAAGAVLHYRLAASRTTNLPERDYLLTRAARLAKETTGGDGPPPAKPGVDTARESGPLE
ncbi:MAG: RNA polymerase sigma factor [Vicinamibacteria bacterium]|nr:RNA polymerase sigma factor [Vicinamibacteria bacterium]